MEFNLLTSQEGLQKKQEELKSAQTKFDLVDGQLAQIRRELKIQTEKSLAVEAERVRLEKELQVLNARRAGLEKSVGSLKAELDSLKKGLEQVREGRIIVLAQEVLAQVSLPEKSGAQAVKAALATLQEQGRVEIAMRSGVKPEQVSLLSEKANELDDASPFIERPSRVVIRLVAASNAVRAEPVLVTLEKHDSQLVFKRGEVLVKKKVAAALKREDAEKELFMLLREVNSLSIKKGVLPDPLRGTVGNLSAGDFYGSVERITGAADPTTISVEAEEDIYSEGPVRVTIVLQHSS